jgi:putative ATP-dependent endonuclease of OLD family
MYISRIFIKNFRNFRSLNVPVQPGLTCIVGENNTGKTNLLHALRLVIDGNISAYQRRLSEADFSSGIDPSTANQILIAVEFSNFTEDVNQEAMLHGCQSDEAGEKAIIAYRFRPDRKARTDIESEIRTADSLIIDDYEWEIRGGTSGLDLDAIEWDTEFGTDFVGFSHMQQNYLVIFMKALRDVESDLKQTRFSPLTQLMNDEDVSEEERNALVEILKEANDTIDDHALIKKVGEESLRRSRRDVVVGAPWLPFLSRTLDEVRSSRDLIDTIDDRSDIFDGLHQGFIIDVLPLHGYVHANRLKVDFRYGDIDRLHPL